MQALRRGPEPRIRLAVNGETVWDGTIESLAEEWRDLPFIEHLELGPDGGSVIVREGWPVVLTAYTTARWWWIARLTIAGIAAGLVLWWVWVSAS